MVKDYYTCSVCGKKFPKGQGIILTKGGLTIYLHSSKCASKFLKLLLERLDEKCALDAIKEVMKELEEVNKSKVREKRI